MIRHAERLALDMLCGLAVFVIFAASAVTTAPPVVRWSAIAGGISVALLLFPLVLERRVRGSDLVESAEPSVAKEGAPSATLRLAGTAAMLVAAIAQAVGMAALFLFGAVLVVGGTPEPSRGLYLGVGISFLLGFIAPFSFLKPRWS